MVISIFEDTEEMKRLTDFTYSKITFKNSQIAV